ASDQITSRGMESEFRSQGNPQRDSAFNGRALDSEAVVQAILPEKDVDGLHVVNAGKLATGDSETGLLSCTPAGAMVLVRHVYGADLSGLNAVVIGRSNLFGNPMAQLLLCANATVTVAHSKTKKIFILLLNQQTFSSRQLEGHSWLRRVG
ncbi:Tetrahydrofolate dehydrogenase/cyclohydrolase, NAD(P)-binding domain, partial [Rhizobium tibeticum]